MVLSTIPHKIYKQGNQVIIKTHNQRPKRFISTITYAEEIDGNIRFAFGAEGIWLSPENFLKADGTAWGTTAEEAVGNYLATNTVMENSSRVNMPMPTPVRVVNFPDAAQGNGGGISSNVSVLNFPETQPVSGNVGVSGHINVDNFPLTQQVSGALEVSNFPETQEVSGSVDVSNFPNVQPVSGEVSVNNFPDVQKVSVENIPATHKVEVINQPGTQAVSGSVGITNLPETQKVTVQGQTHVVVDNLPGTQPVTGTVNIGNLPTTQPVSGTVGIQGGNTQAVKVDNSGVTQPISGSVAVSNIPAIQQIGGMVGVNNFPASQTVTGTVTANVQGGNSSAVKVDGTVNIGNLPASQPVTGTFWQATQPVSIANPVVAQWAPPANTWQFSNASLVALAAIEAKAAAASQRNYVSAVQLSNTAALVSGIVEILDGTTVIGRVFVGAAGSANVTYPIPLRGSVNTAISVRPSIAGLVVAISVQGYTMAT